MKYEMKTDRAIAALAYLSLDLMLRPLGADYGDECYLSCGGYEHDVLHHYHFKSVAEIASCRAMKSRMSVEANSPMPI